MSDPEIPFSDSERDAWKAQEETLTERIFADAREIAALRAALRIAASPPSKYTRKKVRDAAIKALAPEAPSSQKGEPR